jgi:hypothetical protein
VETNFDYTIRLARPFAATQAIFSHLVKR